MLILLLFDRMRNPHAETVISDRLYTYKVQTEVKSRMFD